MRSAVIGTGWLWGLAALPLVTNAGMDFGEPFLLILGGGVIGFAWLGYSVAVPGVLRTSRVRWLWLSVPGIGLTSFALCFTHHDLAARVWVCDSELRGYAEAARQNPKGVSRVPRPVGSFHVRETVAYEKQVMLHTASGFLTSSGIAYRPDGAMPEGARPLTFRCEHLYGPWWWFYEMGD